MCFTSGAREAVFPPVIYSNYVGENWKKKENLLMNFVLFMIFLKINNQFLNQKRSSQKYSFKKKKTEILLVGFLIFL